MSLENFMNNHLIMPERAFAAVIGWMLWPGRGHINSANSLAHIWNISQPIALSFVMSAPRLSSGLLVHLMIKKLKFEMILKVKPIFKPKLTIIKRPLAISEPETD